MPTFNEGLLISVQGILIVFGVLIVLMFVMMALKKVFYKNKGQQEKSIVHADTAPAQQPEAAVTEEMDQNEIAAVIAAAIAVVTAGTSTYNLQIKSIRRQISTVPAWNAAARRENLDARF